MKHRYSYIPNGLTYYRLAAAFLLVFLLFTKRLDLFKWLLPLSFLTDAVDGYLARRYNMAGKAGARLDSIADQLTLAAAIAGLFVFRSAFIRENILLITIVLALYGGQTVLALIRYRRISSFHTYLAKVTGVLSSLFLALTFLIDQPLYFLFFLTAFLACLELLEEITLVLLLPEWKADVKGLYWVLPLKRNEPQ